MSSIKRIKKAIFPVSGLGTRLLPITKVLPKEILPIIDKPIIQFAVEEAVAAGITELIFVTAPHKTVIENFFDNDHELESILKQRHQDLMLAMINDILPSNVTIAFIHQPYPLGLGHAVLSAKNFIEDQPFAVLLADNLIEEAPEGCLKNMIAIYEATAKSIIALNPVPEEDISKYGIAAVGEINNGYAPIHSLIEKPAIEDAPSNISVIGRYILSPRIFSILEQTPLDHHGEIQLTDAALRLLQEETVLGYFLQGKCFDCGSKQGYLQAIVEHALKDPELKSQFENYLSALINK